MRPFAPALLVACAMVAGGCGTTPGDEPGAVETDAGGPRTGGRDGAAATGGRTTAASGGAGGTAGSTGSGGRIDVGGDASAGAAGSAGSPDHELDAGAAADVPAPIPATTKLFDGTTLTGWEGDPKSWSVQDGAITGKTGNGGFLIYTKGDYENFRLTLQSKLVSAGNHLGVCFWGTRQASFGYGGCILTIPPSGGLWDYHPGKGSPPRTKINPPTADPHVWHKSELLVNMKAGTIRMAVNGVELILYEDIDPPRLKRGPIGLQLHAGASEVQYKDLEIEVDPKEDRLLSVPPK
jgi:hypothetical protein